MELIVGNWYYGQSKYSPEVTYTIQVIAVSYPTQQFTCKCWSIIRYNPCARFSTGEVMSVQWTPMSDSEVTLYFLEN